MSQNEELGRVSEILSHLPGLQVMSEAERLALSGHFEILRAEGTICTEGEDADALYVLSEGELEVVKRSSAGKEFVVATMTPVTLFGHVSLITGAGRTASVRANGEVELLRMAKLRMKVLMRSNDFQIVSPFRRALVIALARQLNAANQSMINLAHKAGLTQSLDPSQATEPQDAELEVMKAQSQV